MCDNLLVSHLWDASDNRLISECIIVSLCPRSPDSGSAVAEVEDAVDPEKCVQLLAPLGETALSSPCKLTLHLVNSESESFHKIALLSEAKNIEIYEGDQEEYSATARSELLEDEGDIVMYKSEHIFLKKAVTRITLHLIPSKASNTDKLWFYGMLIEKGKRGREGGGRAESSLQGLNPLEWINCFSSREAFIQGIASKQTVGSNRRDRDEREESNKQSALNSFFKMLPRIDGNGIPSQREEGEEGEGEEEEVKTKKESQPGSRAKGKGKGAAKEDEDHEAEGRSHFGSRSSLDGELKEYLDEKFNQLEARLWDRISRRLDRLESNILDKKLP